MKRVKLNKASLFTLIIIFTPFFTLSIIFPIKTSSELYDNKSINNLINLSSEDPEFPWTYEKLYQEPIRMNKILRLDHGETCLFNR